jgi:carbamoyltransferase
MADAPVILGVNCSFRHDSAAALVASDVLVSACEEERFTRKKHDASLPLRAISACLQIAGVENGDVTHVALGWHPWASSGKRLGFLINGDLQNLGRRLRFLTRLVRDPIIVATEMRRRFPRARIIFVEHHIAHAASAFYASPFDTAAVLTTDGRGEWATGLAGFARGNCIHPIVQSYWPDSLGLAYEGFTHYLGFETHDEFKVMGLSAYGSPTCVPSISRTFSFFAPTLFRVERRFFRHPSFAETRWSSQYYSQEIIKMFGRPRAAGEPLEDSHKDIAKSLQVHLEKVAVDAAQWLHDKTAESNLVMAGGVALNGLMNNAIRTHTPFSNIFIQPASNDAGIPIGAALFVNHKILRRPRTFNMTHAYWGPEYTEAAVKAILLESGLHFYRCSQPEYTGAILISKNYVIGWFQGRTEIGPRALGNRSILADPRFAENRDLVNAKIKFREQFRPFAPSIMSEYVARYFADLTTSPFMLNICPVRPETRATIPAVVHVDGTARPQTVERDVNHRFYSLLDAFCRITGVPMVLNTSFNVKDEPIVNSPSDAVRCFQKTRLDYLIIGDWLVSRVPLSTDQHRYLGLPT